MYLGYWAMPLRRIQDLSIAHSSWVCREGHMTMGTGQWEDEWRQLCSWVWNHWLLSRSKRGVWVLLTQQLPGRGPSDDDLSPECKCGCLPALLPIKRPVQDSCNLNWNLIARDGKIWIPSEILRACMHLEQLRRKWPNFLVIYWHKILFFG